MKKLLNTWSEITREERFFTSVLFHDLLKDSSSLWNNLKDKLEIEEKASVEDVGYEVCFFRDAAHAGLIKKQPHFQKLTFDLVLFLSNDCHRFQPVSLIQYLDKSRRPAYPTEPPSLPLLA